jgi:hypothetical protein
MIDPPLNRHERRRETKAARLGIDAKELPSLKPLLVTVARTEELLGLGHTTVSGLIAKGVLKSRKEGRRRLVLYASIEEFAAAAT